MTEFFTHLGFNMTTPMGVFWLCTSWTFLVVTVIWVIGNFQTDHSMMDGYYGFGYAIPVWIAYLLTSPQSATAAVLLTITSLHGCRLGYYLSNRWVGYQKSWGHGDQRYMGFTRKLSPGYWWKSFFLVMEPQAVVISLIGIPSTLGVLSTSQPAGPLNALSFLGILVFGVGFYFECVADGQLQAFKADVNNKGRYLRTGVWTHSRHPNYFGNTTVWWGIWLVAVAGNHSIWWTVIGPVFNTIMLTGILGRAFQDKFMGVRPEYKKVMEETNSFLPIPKKAGPAMTGSLPPVVDSNIPATPLLVMPAALQNEFLWIAIVLATVVLATSIAMSIKSRSWTPVLMVAGGFAAVLMEPVVTYLGHAVHPPIGQVMLFKSVDRAIPWHIALGYMAGFGVFYLLMFWRRREGVLSASAIWKITAVAALCFYLGEAYPVEHGLWTYYGHQALWIWKGTAPPTWSILNATCMLTSTTLMLTAAPYLKGIGQVLLVPLAVAGAYMGHLGAGFPMYNAMNASVPPWVVEGAGVASIGMAVLIVWLCTIGLARPE